MDLFEAMEKAGVLLLRDALKADRLDETEVIKGLQLIAIGKNRDPQAANAVTPALFTMLSTSSARQLVEAVLSGYPPGS